MFNEPANHELLSQLRILKEKYITLLEDKDVLLNCGKPQLEASYSVKIGSWLVTRLQAQLRIMALQLKIEKLDGCRNLKKEIDPMQIQLEVAAILSAGEEKIIIETAKIESAKQLLSNPDSSTPSGTFRKLYRELAQQLHPDVNNHFTPEQEQIWHLLEQAYEERDPGKLKAMKVMYGKELSRTAKAETELAEEQLTEELAVLKERIQVLQDQILQMHKVFPFTVEANIKDDEWVENETLKRKNELDHLRVYEEELSMQYQNMISLHVQ